MTRIDPPLKKPAPSPTSAPPPRPANPHASMKSLPPSVQPSKEPDSPPQVDLSTESFILLKRLGKISSQNLTTLKAFLKKNGQLTSGKKNDLVERVQEFLSAVEAQTSQ